MAAPLAGVFLRAYLAVSSSTAVKLPDGGWFPVAMAASIFIVMTTWNTGRRFLAEALAEAFLPLDLFLEDVKNTNPTRVRGSAVFMSSNPEGVPPILLHHFKHNQVLHEQVVLLTVLSVHVPKVPLVWLVVVVLLFFGFFRVLVCFGF